MHADRGGTGPEPDSAWVARHGPVAERASLAGDQGLPREALDVLVEDEATEVLEALGWNYSVPSAVLQRIVDRHPELANHVGLNRSAPPELKDRIPLGDHTADSLQQFLDDRRATAAQRAFVFEEYEESDHPGGRQLGEVWSDAVGDALPLE